MIKKEEQHNLIINPVEFYGILVKTLVQPGKHFLNLPETIIKGFSLEKSYLLHTDEGILVYSEDISSYTIEKFYRRCYFYKLPTHPICITKLIQKEIKDICYINHLASECETFWNNNTDIIIQRYIISSLTMVSKTRVAYYPAKNCFTGKLIYKDNIRDFIIRDTDDAFKDDIKVPKEIEVQMVELKNIIEYWNTKPEVQEIVADFIQDQLGIWYFIRFVCARCEIPKKKFKAHKILRFKLEENLERQDKEFKVVDLKQEAIKELNTMIKSSGKKNKKNKNLRFL
jgi:hypothetical protein